MAEVVSAILAKQEGNLSSARESAQVFIEHEKRFLYALLREATFEDEIWIVARLQELEMM